MRFVIFMTDTRRVKRCIIIIISLQLDFCTFLYCTAYFFIPWELSTGVKIIIIISKVYCHTHKASTSTKLYETVATESL